MVVAVDFPAAVAGRRAAAARRPRASARRAPRACAPWQVSQVTRSRATLEARRTYARPRHHLGLHEPHDSAGSLLARPGQIASSGAIGDGGAWCREGRRRRRTIAMRTADEAGERLARDRMPVSAAPTASAARTASASRGARGSPASRSRSAASCAPRRTRSSDQRRAAPRADERRWSTCRGGGRAAILCGECRRCRRARARRRVLRVMRTSRKSVSTYRSPASAAGEQPATERLLQQQPFPRQRAVEITGLSHGLACRS